MITAPAPDAIFDATHLQAVRNLTLRWETPLDLSNGLPTNLKDLLIEGSSITLPSFHRLFHLEVQNSDVINRVELFGSIPVLTFYFLHNVKTLHGLGYDKDSSKNLKNRRVKISHCNSVTDFTALNTVHTVVIENCDQFKSLEQVRDVKDLTIYRCSKITEINVEMKNERLKLKYFPMMKIAFNNLHRVRELDFSTIQSQDASLEGLENLKNLKRISLPADWKEGQSKGWKMLEEEYMKYFQTQFVDSFVIYVRTKRNESIKDVDTSTSTFTSTPTTIINAILSFFFSLFVSIF